MHEPLKNCPFCGAAAHFEMDEGRWEWVECESCGMQGNRSASLMEDCKPKLAEEWNRRTPQPTQPQAGAVPLTDEQIKALMQARRTAMLMTCKARIPECGEFAAIAQDLDWLCESFGIKGGQHGAE